MVKTAKAYIISPAITTEYPYGLLCKIILLCKYATHKLIVRRKLLKLCYKLLSCRCVELGVILSLNELICCASKLICSCVRSHKLI